MAHFLCDLEIFLKSGSFWLSYFIFYVMMSSWCQHDCGDHGTSLSKIIWSIILKSGSECGFFGIMTLQNDRDVINDVTSDQYCGKQHNLLQFVSYLVRAKCIHDDVIDDVTRVINDQMLHDFWIVTGIFPKWSSRIFMIRVNPAKFLIRQNDVIVMSDHVRKSSCHRWCQYC